jgi:hypothetical protein
LQFPVPFGNKQRQFEHLSSDWIAVAGVGESGIGTVQQIEFPK